MNEQYKAYPKAIQDEIDRMRDREVEETKPRKKELTFWQRLRVTLALLSNKTPK